MTASEKKRYDFIKATIELNYLIKRIYEINSAGGSLHIVLDDGNTEDNNIGWCIENSIPEESEINRHIFERCAELLLSVRESDRNLIICASFELAYE